MALFAIVGGLAVDCVRQDHPEYLPKLVEAIADVVEDELATWINENGGWVRCVRLIFQYVYYRFLTLACSFFLLFIINSFTSFNPFTQGGLTTHTNPEKTNFSYMECGALAFGCIFGIIILYFTLRFLGYQIISCLIWVR